LGEANTGSKKIMIETVVGSLFTENKHLEENTHGKKHLAC